LPSQNLMIKRLLSRTRRNKRGQSFIELMFVTLILALMLAGVVEFGFLLNNYLHAVDGAREAARYTNSYAAFNTDGTTINEFYYITAVQAAITMDPVLLDPTLGDDIIISVIRVDGTSIRRFPLEDSDGWSLCGHYAAFVAYFPEQDPPKPVPYQLSADGWNHCPAHDSHISDADISARVGPTAMLSGMLLVEILYNYPQTLKMPLFSNGDFFGAKFSIIPDPIPLYAYTIMPISSAESTLTH
jgi:hypothetical protein